MNNHEFDNRILKPLRDILPDFPALDLRHSYYDLLLLHHQISTCQNQGRDKTLFDDDAHECARREAYNIERLISVLLKSVYFVADVFLCKFIGGIKSAKSASMTSLVSQTDVRLNGLTENELLPAYCVAIYRNKIVAHYDHRRLGSYNISANGVLRLAPMPSTLSIKEDDVEQLKSLRESSKEIEPNLTEIKNHFELLNKLFCSVPIGNLGSKNADRSAIDKIAERGGCRSKSSAEVVQALADFCVGITRCLQPGT